MSQSEKGSPQLFKSLETLFIKHRKALHILGAAQNITIAYINSGHATDMLVAAMNDPNIKVPALDKDIPRMQLEDHTHSKASNTDIKVSH
jgi:hypothetical protein